MSTVSDNLSIWNSAEHLESAKKIYVQQQEKQYLK